MEWGSSCNLGVLDLWGALHGRICLRRAGNTLRCLCLGNVNCGVGFSGQAGSWFICLAFLISLYHGASVVTPPPFWPRFILQGLHLGYGRCEGTVPGSFEDICRILLCAGSGLAKHREFGSRRV